jgi:hypothetical protein
VTRSDGKNKQLAVWLSKEDYKKLENWLDKFSTGETFSDQMRTFIHWLVSHIEGLDQTKLALKLQQTEDEKRKRKFHCLRGVMQDW